MASDKERREIARRLRAAAKTKSNSADYLWRRLEIAVNGWRYGDAINDSYTFDNDVLARLADLIDPTCTAPLGEHEHGWLTRECSECGYTIKTGNKYCPNCGRRVVRDD